MNKFARTWKKLRGDVHRPLIEVMTEPQTYGEKMLKLKVEFVMFVGIGCAFFLSLAIFWKAAGIS